MATEEHFITDGPTADRVWDSAKYADETPGLPVHFTVTKSDGENKQTLTARVTGVMRDDSLGVILIISGFIGDATFTGRYHSRRRKGILTVTVAGAERQKLNT